MHVPMTAPWDESIFTYYMYLKINHLCRYIYNRSMDPSWIMTTNCISIAQCWWFFVGIFDWNGFCCPKYSRIRKRICYFGIEQRTVNHHQKRIDLDKFFTMIPKPELFRAFFRGTTRQLGR